MAKTTTPELIEEILSNYKENMSYILLGFAFFSTLLTGLLQYVQNLRLAKKVEAYKNELSKREIKFSRHSEMQIECLKNYYDHIATLHFSFLSVQSREDHHSLKNAIKEAQKDFQTVLFFSQRNRILLTEEILVNSRIIFNKVKDWNALANIELNEMNYLEERDWTTDTERLYRNSQHESEEVKKIKNKLKTNPKIIALDDDINNLRKVIEDYFQKLVG